MSKPIQKSKAKYPKLKRLQGLMKEYDITVAQLAKNIGRAVSTVSKANNGHNLFDSMDMLNIQKLINSKAVKSGKKYTIDEIFFS
jgi:transcriptional regulator with XRE-family HTH domain